MLMLSDTTARVLFAKNSRYSLSEAALVVTKDTMANWNDWWTYEGISGPDFWGRLNPGLWGLCSTGRRQSPINIEPQRLLFDPQLLDLQVGKARVHGILHNTGQGVVFRLETTETPINDISSPSKPDTAGHVAEYGQTSTARTKVPTVNITGGPLSYSYRVYEIQLHFGRQDHQGSEHLLAGFSFPAEVQIYAYNSELYENATEARSRAYGIAAVSMFVKVANAKEALPKTGQHFLKESNLSKPNLELKMLTDQLQHIIYKGDSVVLKALSVHELLPNTSALITYEGSLTAPGCEETATWILLNRPLYVSSQQLLAMRKLKQGELTLPVAPLGNNFRPPQPLHQRAIRTNIDLYPDRNIRNQKYLDDGTTEGLATTCPSMQVQKFYQVSSEHVAITSRFSVTTKLDNENI
ncbi:carbonic anhydrase-related protein 10-like isoform X2 [Varroa jacobsoni]|uniref:carbonic anhydrase-related protein 10-like isoform X2 n=1 Tax=Varroa jacobsoni TaxID=62625 RepID=UPI000BF709E4|nr:carbonic anhydrase-related protein 10-like isoform X2 [Varroa jacobsoni]